MFQRRAPRVPVDVKAVLDDGDNYATAQVVDLSETGLFATGDLVLAEGATLRIIPLDDVPLPELSAEVVRITMPGDTEAAPAPHGLGFRFSGLSDDQRQKVRAFCREQRAYMAERQRARHQDAPARDEAVSLATRTVPTPASWERPGALFDADTPLERHSTHAGPPPAPGSDEADPAGGAAEASPVPEVTDRSLPVRLPPPPLDDDDEDDRGPFIDPFAALPSRADLTRSEVTEVVRKPFDETRPVVRLWPVLFVQLLTVAVFAGALFVLTDEQRALREVADQRVAGLDQTTDRLATDVARLVEEHAALSAAQQAAGPGLSHDVRIRLLEGTDKAAVVLTQELRNASALPREVAWVRTRVSRAALPAALLASRAGVVELSGVDRSGLTWVAMRDVLVRGEDASLDGFDLDDDVTRRFAKATSGGLTGPLGAGVVQSQADAFLVAVAPPMLLQVITDVGVRDGEHTATVMSQSSLHLVGP